jgi:H+/Cl- antiporter ClcA
MVMGKWIMLAGLALVIIGAVVHYVPWAVSWFGRLPGDINIESENGRVFIPITSTIIISLALSILVNIFRRWF